MQSSQPQTLAELSDCVDRNFHCMGGPPRAYFELPLGSVNDGNTPIYRFVYQTVGFMTQVESDTDDPAPRLIAAMVAALAAARAAWGELEERPMLFWRRHFELDINKDFDSNVTIGRLTCRLVIPGYTFPPAVCPGEGYRLPEV